MYHSEHMDPENNVRSLQNKVQWDIRYYFARRGGEGMQQMTKKTFALKRDEETGFCYIAKVMDEETKNHKETDTAIITGYMPEIPNNKMCPVHSYLTYVCGLSPEVDNLWQVAKFTEFPANPRQKVWYGPTPTGHNPLDTFVSTMAKKCGLGAKKYTNHSWRVTAITALSKCKFSNKEIMAITGHKSSSSLEVYQRVHGGEKMKMGHTLGLHLTSKPTPALMAPQQPLPIAAPQPSTSNALVPVGGPLTTIDLQQAQIITSPEFPEEDPFPINEREMVKFVEEVEKENEIMMSQTKRMKTSDGSIMTEQQVMKKNSPKLPPFLFHGCKIDGNITINIQK